MSTGDLLNVQPTELKFPFELRKQSSCSMRLTNKTDHYVAFKVKTTNPKKYCVRPNTGVVLPGATCDVTVTMQAQKEAPLDIQCKDKFLVQSVVVPAGTTSKDLTPEVFNKEDGKVLEEFKLRVVYIPANPPSPVPEESEEGSPPHEIGDQTTSLASAVIKSLDESKERNSEAYSLISKLTDEKASALQQSQKLRQELLIGWMLKWADWVNAEMGILETHGYKVSQDMLKREISRKRSGGVSLLFVVLIGILGVLIGYFLKRT